MSAPTVTPPPARLRDVLRSQTVLAAVCAVILVGAVIGCVRLVWP